VEKYTKYTSNMSSRHLLFSRRPLAAYNDTMTYQYKESICSSSGDRQRDSGVLPGDNSTTRRARAEIVQQGSTHSEDGLVHPRTFS
jgi:hypothetical protein